MLKEAIYCHRGVSGLTEYAKEHFVKHPSLTLEALIVLQEQKEYKMMLELGNEAVNSINENQSIRGEIALKTAFAEHQVGNVKQKWLLWNEAFRSKPNEVNYLRLFLNADVAQTYGLQSANNMKNIFDNTTKKNLQFLSGKFEKVKRSCTNTENSLGWSDRYIGTGVKLFLLYWLNDK